LEGIVADSKAAARAQAQETANVVARETEAVARCEQLQAYVRRLEQKLATEGAEHVKAIEEAHGKYQNLSDVKVCIFGFNLHTEAVRHTCTSVVDAALAPTRYHSALQLCGIQQYKQH
jgi:hypothetical protein